MALRRLRLAFDDADPRFAALAQLLDSMTRSGRASPIPRMLAELARQGLQLELGQIGPGPALGSTAGTATGTESQWDRIGIPDPAALLVEQRLLAEQSDGWGFE